MSRLLVLLPSVPYPLDSGARIRNHGLLKLLARQNELDAIAFGPTEAAPDLATLARRVAVVSMPRPRSQFRRAVDLARSDLPDMAERLWSAEFMSTVCRFLQENAYDGVQAEGIEMARYLGAVPPERRIYDAHNAEFLLQRRFVNGGSVLARLYSRLQWRRLERFERAVVGGSRLTLAVSNHDANQLLALAGHEANVQVVTNAIDASAYTFRTPPDQLAPNLIFVGKLDFRPNVDALRWFIGDVLTRVDGARLFAVGAGPPKWLVRAGQLNNRIAVTGYVPDERPYLARAAALVLPVRTGAGSRLKALIAMASGVPIISTRFGMEGLDAEPGTHFFAAESASEWVTAIRDVLREPDLRRNLACNGRALVEQRYDWTSVAPDIQRAYAFLNV